MQERVQKLIAKAGLSSRRGAERMIEQGRVMINGRVATLGDKANPEEDTIRVDGKDLPKPEPKRYYLVHKPKGILSSVKSQEQMPDRPLISDLVPDDVRLYPVGRLDLNSEGLVLMTNDGNLANRLTHPRYGHKKTYKVTLSGAIYDERLNSWERGGIRLEDGFVTSPCTIKLLDRDRRTTVIRISLREGHKRQIRETAEKLGHNVLRLVRTHIGPLELGDLPPGQFRELTRDEVTELKDTLKKESSSNQKKDNRGRRNNRR